MHLCCVISLCDIWYGHASTPLLQKPDNELLATSPLLQCAGNESNVSNILQNGACCHFEFLPCGSFLSQSVAQLIVFEDHTVGVKALGIRRLVPYATCECTRCLGLDATHGLELGTSARTLAPKNDQLLAPTTTSTSFVSRLVHEEHQNAPFLLHESERCASSASDVANAIAGDIHDSAVVSILPAIDIHRTLQLFKQPLHVLTCLSPFCASA
mmetsp:Transcript_95211/g.183588  ORF Transcript_95211/g.183588 Transcript_95211/m.183588 type:complete len:213 (-) Transcript_95211:877-1515(-)